MNYIQFYMNCLNCKERFIQFKFFHFNNTDNWTAVTCYIFAFHKTSTHSNDLQNWSRKHCSTPIVKLFYINSILSVSTFKSIVNFKKKFKKTGNIGVRERTVHHPGERSVENIAAVCGAVWTKKVINSLPITDFKVSVRLTAQWFALTPL